MGVHMSRREWVDQHQSSPGVAQGGQVHEKDSSEKAKGKRESSRQQQSQEPKEKTSELEL